MGRKANPEAFKITEVVYGEKAGDENPNTAFLTMAAVAIRIAERELYPDAKASVEKKSRVPIERT